MNLINDYLFSIKMVESTGHALGEKLVELLKPLVKDLSFTLGGTKVALILFAFFPEHTEEIAGRMGMNFWKQL